MSNKTIHINVPVLARVEGEGALDLRIDNGTITDLKLRIYEPPRYFEKFLEGRSYKDVPDTVARICGICPVAYQMSAVHAIEAVFAMQATAWARNMRRLMYCGEWLQSHSLHIHMLAAPDFLGFNSIIEMAAVYPDEVRRGLKLQGLGNDIMHLLGGRSVHPVGVCAGGFYHAPKPADVAVLRDRLLLARQDTVELLHWTASLALADDEQDFVSVSLRHDQEYAMNEGRIVSDRGLAIGIEEFAAHFEELHRPQSTALHCLLHGEPYLVGPLARLNNNLDQLPVESRELLATTGISFPSRNMFHSIIARAVEIHFALHEAIRLLQEYEVPAQPFETVTARAGVGYGCTEAPRGILWHRYELDAAGQVISARIVPPTSQNQARIEQDIEAALNHFGLDRPDADLQLHAEKVIRNYDPCISCATHFLRLQVQRTPATTASPALTPGTAGTLPVTLIAIGSPQPPDDVAWRLLDRLAAEPSLDAAIRQGELELLKLDRPGTRLLDRLTVHRRVILLDCLAGGGADARLLRLQPAQLQGEASPLSSHGLGVAEGLQLGAALGLPLDGVTVLAIPLDAVAGPSPDLEPYLAQLKRVLLPA